ncbi:MAG: redoxin domain-containing protein [Armatimonadota bacterium]|nr:redoxin domain-containing protein [Armatimonadota bacterium]
MAVSVDPAEGEKGQIAFAKHLGVDFPLLPDTGRHLSILYQAAQNTNQVSSRMSVLIDKNGIVRWIDKQINTGTHGSDILAKMREFGLAK